MDIIKKVGNLLAHDITAVRFDNDSLFADISLGDVIEFLERKFLRFSLKILISLVHLFFPLNSYIFVARITLLIFYGEFCKLTVSRCQC